MGSPTSQPKITDLSSITPETLKEQNTDFWRRDVEYETVIADHHTRRRIWNTRNGDLRRLVRDFPTDVPIDEQCASWIHAVVGREFFPDANHRTAVASLRELLRENGMQPGRWPPAVTRATAVRSHRIRKETANVCLDTLYRRDRLFLVWVLYFKTVLRVRRRV